MQQRSLQVPRRPRLTHPACVCMRQVCPIATRCRSRHLLPILMLVNLNAAGMILAVNIVSSHQRGTADACHGGCKLDRHRPCWTVSFRKCMM